MHRLVDFVGDDGAVRTTADNAEFLLGLMSNVGGVLSTASVRTPDASTVWRESNVRSSFSPLRPTTNGHQS